jgi:D-alanine-D-alanine ligase
MTKFFGKQLNQSRKKRPPHVGEAMSESRWRVAVLANVYFDRLSPDDPPDKGGDYDSVETINRICNIIQKDGHVVQFIQADRNLPQRILDYRPDICFNISEGIRGDAREAQVPGFLELLGIPYTGSRVLTNAIALDKPLTKTIWAAAGLPIAESQAMTRLDEPVDPKLTYPLIVKPSREGSGMGLDPDSVVYNETQLREQASKIINRYHQPALVEKFLPGREFTVGIMGRPGAQERRPDFYNQNGYHFFPIVEVETPTSTNSICDFAIKHVDADRAFLPKNLSEEFRDRIYDIVVRGHEALGALDISRTDIRCDENGIPHLLEINPLPGLSANSHIPTMVKLSGMSYDELVLEILHLGATRYDLRRTEIYPVKIEFQSKRIEMGSHHPVPVL